MCSRIGISLLWSGSNLGTSIDGMCRSETRANVAPRDQGSHNLGQHVSPSSRNPWVSLALWITLGKRCADCTQANMKECTAVICEEFLCLIRARMDLG